MAPRLMYEEKCRKCYMVEPIEGLEKIFNCGAEDGCIQPGCK